MNLRLMRHAFICASLGALPAHAADPVSVPELRCPYRPTHAAPLAMSAEDYPLLSIAQNEQGIVVLDFLIKGDGSIADIKVVRSSDSPRLDGAAVDAAGRRWRFDPVLVNGKAISCRNSVGVVWKLEMTPDELAQSGFTVIRRGASDYPRGSLIRREEGQSVVMAMVNPAGKIMQVMLSQTSGSSELDSAALEEVKSGKWPVTPPLVLRKPVTAMVGFVIVWSLSGH